MVTEHILRIPLADLERIRVTCKLPGCGKVHEVAVAEAATVFFQGACKYCGEPWLSPNTNPNDNPMKLLTTVWRFMEKLKDSVSVDFIVPVDDAE